MTAAFGAAFGTTAAVLIVGTPLATLCMVGAIYIHESIEARRYRQNPNVGLWLEREDDDTQEWDIGWWEGKR